MTALSKQAAVAVIGAGAMGAGIAQVAAQAGHPVALFDTREGAAAQAIAGIAKQLGKRVDAGKLDGAERDAIVARLTPAARLEDLEGSRLVVEAIVENLAVKRGLFEQLETICGAECILASNTSSLSITSLAATLKRPERVAGA